MWARLFVQWRGVWVRLCSKLALLLVTHSIATVNETAFAIAFGIVAVQIQIHVFAVGSSAGS